MANKRITDVDFIESLNGSESFFINQNSAIKQINRVNIFKDTVFDIEKGGTGATDADGARINLNAQKNHGTETTILSVGGWSNNMQTISVSIVTENNTIFVSPSPTSHITYAEYGIYCTEQSVGKLTFVCDSIPNDDITINVVAFDKEEAYDF